MCFEIQTIANYSESLDSSGTEKDAQCFLVLIKFKYYAVLLVGKLRLFQWNLWKKIVEKIL